MARIVVGVDPSPAGQAAMRWALREALAGGLPLKALRAWLTPAFGRYYPPGSPLADRDPEACVEAQQLADEQLKHAREEVPGTDTVEADGSAVMGAPPQVLLDAGRDAAMIVVGSRGHGALSRAVLGSVSSSVVHHAHCPVVVVPAEHDGPVTRVLVGVDHSPGSLSALRLGVAEARRHDVPLAPVLVHEMVWTAAWDSGGLAGLEARERQALVSAATAAGATGLQIDPQIATGQPSATLLRLAGPQDLLVVGSRGRGGFAGLLLGSTSTQCAQHAPCPVVVVRT